MGIAKAQNLVAPALVLLVLAVIGAVYLSDRALYAAIMVHWGDYPDGPPFADLRSVLTQLECHRAGIAVIEAARAFDDCGVYNYSPLLLGLPVRIDPASSDALGLVLCCVFAASLVFLPVRRAPRDVVFMALAVLSGAVMWALASANVDLIMFELALAVSALACLRGRARFAAYAVALLAGLVKYYPVVLMGHALSESRRAFLWPFAIGVAVAALFVAVFHGQLAASMEVLPAGSVLRGRWGAQILPLGIQWLAGGARPEDMANTAYPLVAFVALFAAAIAAVIWLARRPAMARALPSLPDWPRALLISGALIVVGCFAAWQNLPFRGIFLLLALPGLLMLTAEPGEAGPLRNLPALVLLLMWQGPLSQGVLHLMVAAGLPEAASVLVQLTIWLVTQAIWWWVVVLLAAILHAGLVLPFVRRFAGQGEGRGT
ncbi:MAG: hypothetical protein AB7O49_19155 [Sphingomonadales bacterium]